MPRKARKKSVTGIYHVIMRGVNHQQIFYEESDYYKFLETLQHYSNVSGYKIFAYSLMGNHIHLLIQEGEEKLGTSFKRIGASFAYWYNMKYDRSGHIFQDRFKSEPVDTLEYFFVVIRYILRNPVVAGIIDSPENYKFSNARHLLFNLPTFTDTQTLYEYITPEQLSRYLMQDNEDKCLDIEKSTRKGFTDESAIDMIKQEFGTINPQPGTKGSNEREKFCNSIHSLLSKGLAKRQISRLTGLPRTLF